MNLCIDIGNTFYKVAIFDSKELVYSDRFKRGIISALEKLQDEWPIEHSILSSTRRRNKKLLAFLNQHKNFVELDAETEIPIKNDYGTPKTLGRDRLAAVIGVYMANPGAHLVIDAGTCITYDVITAKGTYIGGNIAPGIHMRIEAMHHFTQKLPIVEMELNPSIIGKSTEEALQNGAVYGTLLEMETFIKRMKNQHRGINITLTGGDADFLAKHLKTQIFVDHHLVLRGLNEIITYHA